MVWHYLQCGADSSPSDSVQSQQAQMRGWIAWLTSNKKGDLELTRRGAHTLLVGDALDGGLQN